MRKMIDQGEPQENEKAEEKEATVFEKQRQKRISKIGHIRSENNYFRLQGNTPFKSPLDKVTLESIEAKSERQ